MAQIRVLTLNKNQFDESVLYRLDKDQILKFVLGPSLMGHDVHLFTNYPAVEEEEVSVFDRSKWRELSWQVNSRHKNDDLDKWAEIACEIAGPFGYYYTCDDSTEHCGSGFFQIAPTLHIGHENVELPLDCIQCQTMLTKCLGPFDEWESRLRVAHESGYNMVHLTPVQTLGQSESSYSLKNQHEFNPLFSPGDKKYNFDDLKKLTTKMKDEWGVLTISDVVYNHTSDDSPWLGEHPECAYNLKNSPHLRPAFLLCRILTQFGRQVAENFYENRGLPALITTEDHLNAMRSILRDEILPPYKFSEFFQLNVDRIKSEFIPKLDNYHDQNSDQSSAGMKSLEILQDKEFRRLNSTIDFDLALRLFAREG
uniref:Glycogen debranching enzyme n=1 Tax=Romanomermis culicivorax TaxID=13658 RepID=A0A915IB28_ROMCU